MGFPQNCTAAASAGARYTGSRNGGTTVTSIAIGSFGFAKIIDASSRVVKAFVDRWNCIGAASYCPVFCTTVACSQMVNVGLASA